MLAFWMEETAGREGFDLTHTMFFRISAFEVTILSAWVSQMTKDATFEGQTTEDGGSHEALSCERRLMLSFFCKQPIKFIFSIDWMNTPPRLSISYRHHIHKDTHTHTFPVLYCTPLYAREELPKTFSKMELRGLRYITLSRLLYFYSSSDHHT